jgi:hypothetical protein
MIVVADTTPLRYLVAIAREHLLPALYGRVLIPPAVADELSHENTPEVVRAWLAAQPSWLEIRQPTRTLEPEVDLDRGERDAIALAEELLPTCYWWTNGMLAWKRNVGTYALLVRCACWPMAQAAASTISKNRLSACATRTSA